MTRYHRLLNLQLPQFQTVFLWGPRQTGKSTLLKERFPDSAYFDLLDRRLAQSLSTAPGRFRELVQALPDSQKQLHIIVDEIQKAPDLLDDIHWLIENKNLSFVLTGSSARKMKRGHANLLGGRAWKYHLHPFCSAEIPDFDLLKALQRGMLPRHYQSTQFKKSLDAYVSDYIAEEIQSEALVRNIPAFSKFLRALAYTHGGLTNYAALASDCGVDAKTVKEYYQILIDTLLGYELLPYKTESNRSKIQKSSKFYLFDVGIANFLMARTVTEMRGSNAGDSFEHFIFLELVAAKDYKDLGWNIRFWRTHSGKEVDFILHHNHDDKVTAIECKISDNIKNDDMKGLMAFVTENPETTPMLVCQEPFRRTVEFTLPGGGKQISIQVLPWKEFLDDLWNGRI